MEPILEKTEYLRHTANTHLHSSQKAKLGQFMTPAPIASFMASMFSPEKLTDSVQLLDPGCGIGSLTTAFLSQWQHKIKPDWSIDCFEVDKIMQTFFMQNRAQVQEELCQRSISFRWNLITNDFISEAHSRLLENFGIFGEFQDGIYTHCIMNPPYGKLSHNSKEYRLLRSLGIGTVNFYTAFLSLAILLLKSGGELSVIIPRSFCNGTYFKPFRTLLLKNTAIRKIHLFESRKKAFQDDNVLQENIILFLEKNGIQKDIELSTSTDCSFTDICKKTLSFDHVIDPLDTEQIIHIPVNSTTIEPKWQKLLNCTLEDLGIQVSTGPVVDFRMRSFLCNQPTSETVPLLYPCHFSDHKTNWPKLGGKKPNAILFHSETLKWLYPCGYYTVLRRFSAKEEKRRLIASTVEPDQLKQNGVSCRFLAFENHLNVFHENKQGLPELLARGLTAFLNSAYLDSYFREFSGHTQVNAGDLRRLKYPSRKNLLRLGKWYTIHSEKMQESIDSRLLSFLEEDHA